ncbi:prolyl oligopeptidase family serine peptidase [Microtetraspora sp. NBRC 16547]|uniref:S9 family peptidase n=1 Tax=Microtetraspora sp. NBRC 16547 TaxID=3030993 RepID=UPI0024A2A77B|nr:prolyl oligopeptidase family serine peptidase [Microtetraspora sp. NBRC 16547]GLW97962.1 acyl-peptide hydrolase [Microtetraspora sp. NBRC 16547]
MPPEPTPVPYAAWPSPISTTDVARSGLSLGFPTVLGEDLWWEEDRPAEGGRRTVVHRDADGILHELLPAPWDARTRVHEYGGRSYAVVPGRGVLFAHHRDQRLYLAAPGTEPWPLTPEPGRPCGLRYADLLVHDGPDGPEVWCVRERHHDDGAVSRSIVSIPLTERPGSPVPDGIVARVSGNDFYASPTLSPDGRHLAYICWDHPRMPWSGTELRVTRLSDGRTWTVAGGAEESVLAPCWRDDRTLYFVSDRSGWWNLYQAGVLDGSCRALHPAEEEFAGPLWQLGGRPYQPLDDGRIAVLHGRGDLRLSVLDPATGTLSDVEAPYSGWAPALACDGRTVAGIAYGPRLPRAVVRLDGRSGRVEWLCGDTAELPDAAYLPTPRAVEIESGAGRAGRVVHAYLYPPSGPGALDAADAAATPYVVFVHGGPTGHATTELSLEKAFFTSRGIGVLDLNYGGSTGYGRAYRERLRGQWGVIDVEDAVAAARWLAAENLADPARIAIRGGSAGGWTVMAACCASDVFAGGVSIAGVSALAPLVAATHDFESRYIDWLVGPETLYGSREPLARAGEIDCPMLLMQGLADPVVPPAQSEAFADELSARGVPCTYLAFEGESHGFRRHETRATALAAELSFYRQIFHTAAA